ncbi:MAG: KpsF/GutQ family sugar-phosphate isomerase [Rikenellaceae bacterium]
MTKVKQYAIDTLKLESEAVMGLIDNLDNDFELAVEAILECTGKVIVTGMGKSGLVGSKIAATLASTGTPSFFLHPAEAYHGDLGMISSNDVILALANSGQTDEILKLIPFFEYNKNIVIALTGNPNSTLAKHANFHLNTSVKQEACPLNLAPTSSTTAMMAMGDALAVALINEREFKEEDYAVFHPGGSLGRRLLTRVKDVKRGDNLPFASESTPLSDVIIVISDARLGIAIVVEGDELKGVITDGDVRRAMAKYKGDFFNLRASDIMSKNPKTILETERIAVAEQMMRDNKIHSVVVVDEEDKISGIVEFFNVSVLG